MAEHQDDPATWPALGRAFSWVNRPGSDRKLMWGLIAVCVLLVLAPLAVHRHVHFAFLETPGMYGFMGFVFFSALILAAKYLRRPITRPEDYYAPKSVDTEPYPEGGLERIDNDA